MRLALLLLALLAVGCCWNCIPYMAPAPHFIGAREGVSWTPADKVAAGPSTANTPMPTYAPLLYNNRPLPTPTWAAR